MLALMIRSLDDAFLHVLKGLPFADGARFIVGPLASRESVKDRMVELSPKGIIPGNAVSTLSELASEILNGSRIAFEKPLSSSDRIDALQTVSYRKKIAERLPTLSQSLKKRAVAEKLSRLLLGLDRFYSNFEELDAIIDAYAEKKPEVAEFLSIISILWKAGELKPWSDYENLRTVLNEKISADFCEKVIYLWGFQEFTPLEEAFLKKIKEKNRVVFLVPQQLSEIMKSCCEKAQIELCVLDSESVPTEIKLMTPHTLIDEIHFLADELRRLHAEGVAFSDIGIFVPQDVLYKRLLRQKLHEWNVPMQDPTLADAWIDHADWIYWRDFLKCLATGMNVGEVKALAAHELDSVFEKTLFDLRITHGASSWKRFLTRHSSPTVEALLLVFKNLVQFQNPAELFGSFNEILPKLGELIKKDTEILEQFLKHLAFERPYLQGVGARLNRYVDYFEEFLKAQSRKNSIRSRDGVWVLAHGVWIPKKLHSAFVLSSQTITRAQPSFDPWEWEGIEVRNTWERLHFGLSFKQRIERDFSILQAGLLNQKSTVLSAVTYDLEGKPLPRGFFVTKLEDLKKSKFEVLKNGGHLRTGWLFESNVKSKNEKDESSHIIKESESFQKLWQKPLSVTKFEDYLKCPYLFYGRHILKLDERHELDLVPSPLSRGNLIHHVLETMIRDEIENGKSFPLDHAKARKRATEILDAALDVKKIEGLYQSEALFQSARSEIFSRINYWIDWEITYRLTHPTMKPIAVEVAIDMSLVLDGGQELKIKGKVDRVDSDGSKCVIIDYKTGDAPFIGKEMLQGQGVQLLAYANAVGRQFNLEPVAAYYLTIKKESKITGGLFNKNFNKSHYTIHNRNSGVTEKNFSEIYQDVFQVWEEKALKLSKGDFSAIPLRPLRCQECTFFGICGVKNEPNK